MKKILAFILSAAMLTAIPAYAETEQQVPQIKNEGDSHEADKDIYDVKMIINPGNVIREADHGLLGMGSGWNVGNSYLMESTSSTEFNSQFKNLMKKITCYDSTRTSGSDLSHFNWKACIGKYEDRKNANIEGHNYYSLQGSLNFGPVEWFKSGMAMNPDCKFIVGLNVTNDTLQNNLDYVEFCLGDASTEWGRKRIEQGLPDPINVAAFELGNEVDWKGVHKEPDYELLNSYLDKAEAIIDGAKEKFPEAKFIVCGKTYPLEDDIDFMGWKYWHIGIAERLGHKVDYISHHAYYDGQRLAHIEKYLDKMQEEMQEIIGDDHIKFCFTEQAKWPDQGDVSGWNADSFALSGCLSTAEFLNRMYQRTDTAYASYFNFVDAGAWAVIKQKDGKLYLLGPQYMYNMYQDCLGERVVESSVESDTVFATKTENDCKFTALATVSGDRELKLILVNKSDKMKFNINFDFGGNSFTLKEETVFTAPDLYSRVLDDSTEDIFTTTTAEKNEPGVTSYVMPEKSVVGLTLVSDRKIGSGSQNTKVTYDGEENFSDLDFKWYANEVNLLAKDGVISGFGDGTFRPENGITRAEFASLLCNALVKEKRDGQKIFDDVNPGDWYYDAVYNLYAEGYIRGKSAHMFAPQDNITLEEMFAVIAGINMAGGTYEPAEAEYLSGFAYADKISDWAKSAVCFAVKNGYADRMYENGQLDVTRNATRAEAAVILYRLIENAG